jgi:hypothetical protein
MYLVIEPLLTVMAVMMITINKLLYTVMQDKLELKN